MQRKKVLGAVAVAGALGAGSVAGFLIGTPGLSGAQTPTPSVSQSPVGHPGSREGAEGPGGPLAGSFAGRLGSRLGALLDVAAKALGITPTELRADLRGGQSIAAVAKAKNIDVQAVINALAADATTRIDAAVSAGKLTAAQATAIKANLAARITAYVNRTPPAKPPAGVTPTFVPGLRGVGRPVSLDVAAQALGITAAELRTDLRAGQSIAAVAKAKNVDVATVITALTTDATARIDAAVSAGKLTAAQATTLKANVTERITAFVNQIPPAPGTHPGFGGFGGFGRDGGDGPGGKTTGTI